MLWLPAQGNVGQQRMTTRIPRRSVMRLLAVAACTVHMLPRVVGGVIEPSLVVLAKKYNQEKKICRM